MIGSSRIAEIEAIAEDRLSLVFEDSRQSSFPVPVERLAQKMGLETKLVTFSRRDVSGALDVPKGLILVDARDPKTRQAFTIAHELGHTCLHRALKQDVFNRNTPALVGTKLPLLEQEANWFAASLLMPRKHVIFLSSVNIDVTTLAKYFGVSGSAMMNRLRNLNLVSRRTFAYS